MPLDTKAQDLSLEDMLRNIDLKKDKKSEPFLTKRPVEVSVSQAKPKETALSDKRTSGWEDDDLEIELEEHKVEEKKDAEPETDKKSKLFSRIMEVKSFVAAKKEEARPLKDLKTGYFDYPHSFIENG